MTRLVQLRIALAALGVLVFGYGIRADADRVRWVGVGLLAVAFLLRFIGPAGRG